VGHGRWRERRKVLDRGFRVSARFVVVHPSIIHPRVIGHGCT